LAVERLLETVATFNIEHPTSSDVKRARRVKRQTGLLWRDEPIVALGFGWGVRVDELEWTGEIAGRCAGGYPIRGREVCVRDLWFDARTLQES